MAKEPTDAAPVVLLEIQKTFGEHTTLRKQFDAPAGRLDRLERQH